jgi:geranyl-CoA carboxylase beta subunit
MPLAGYRMHDDKDGSSAGGGSVAGIGYVEGVRCVVSRRTRHQGRHGGALRPAQGPARAADRDGEQAAVVNLVESGGANLLYQAEIFVPGGRGFANQARMSARGIPQVTVVHGSRPRAAPTCPAFATTSSWCATRPRCFLAGRRS